MPVLVINLNCALVFILQADLYAPAFELTGLPGQTAIRSVGILFVMWNIPYIFALIDPRVHRASLLSAWLMQLTGVVGESWLFLTIPELPVARVSILRFVIFDAVGLLFLVAAYVLVLSGKSNAQPTYHRQ